MDPRGIVGRIYETLLHINLLAVGLMVSEKNIFKVFLLLLFHYKSMEANEPRGVANLDPRDMVGRIDVGDHLTLLHTKYLSSGPYGFREDLL